MVHSSRAKIPEDISGFQVAFAGGAAGAITRAVAQPLDVLKIRFQLQLEPIKKGSKYSSIIQATSSIIKEEGLHALWSGHIPAQFLSITYGVLQFSTYEKLIDICKYNYPETFEHYRHSINFLSGATAATVATFVSFPFDTVRTRLIAEPKTKKAYKGFTNALTSMVRIEGPLSLFKGLLPSIAQIAPHTGIQFVVYKLFTENIFNELYFFQRNNNLGAIELNLLGSLLSGSIAGLVAKTVIYPCDLIKKRLQIQGFQDHRQSFGKQMYCNGLVDCINMTVKEEGFIALYKGFGPSVFKAILASALHFAVYDEIKYFFLKL